MATLQLQYSNPRMNMGIFFRIFYKQSVKKSCQRNGVHLMNCAKFHFSSSLRLHTKHDRRKSTYFLTTPIFYANAAPHIGHLYTALLADTVARWYKLLGHEVIFTTGTDEHGLKIMQAAAAANKQPKLYCDEVSEKFKTLFAKAEISYTDYIRTTEDRHIKAAQTFWKVLEDKGYIYKGTYEGWYSIADEAFLKEGDVKDITDSNGYTQKVSVESEQPVTWMKESNYMFTLSEFSDKLIKWYDTNVIVPSKFTNVIRNNVAKLTDLSISRERNRLQWGIPVPGDDTQTMYVWLDALVNYLTVIGYPDSISKWPVDCHVIGKDILTFHAVYWPAFLMAADLPLPKQILCHSHWTVDGTKMSKSKGNVVDPIDRMMKYTPEGLKFFLLLYGMPEYDGNYIEKSVIECINSQLVNTFGNLLSRCCSTLINPENIFPTMKASVYAEVIDEENRKIFEKLKDLPDIVDGHYKSFCAYNAITIIFDHIRWANKLFADHKPWNLLRSADSKEHYHCILHMSLETLRVSAILLQPVIPKLCSIVLDKLNIPLEKRTVDHVRTGIEFYDTVQHKLSTETPIIMQRIKQ